MDMKGDEDVSSCRICLDITNVSIDMSMPFEKTNALHELEQKFPEIKLAAAVTYWDCFQMCTHIELPTNEHILMVLCKDCAEKLINAYECLQKSQISEILLKELSLKFKELESNLLNEEEFDKKKTKNVEYFCSTCYDSFPSKMHLDDHFAYKICEKCDIFHTIKDMEKNITTCESLDELQNIRIEINDNDGDQPQTPKKKKIISNDVNSNNTADTADCESSDEAEISPKSTYENFEIEINDAEPQKPKRKKRNSNASNIARNARRREKNKAVNNSERPTFECDQCSKIYFHERSLLLHKRIHTGETLPCEVCGKGFVNNKELSVHMRFHNRDYPYVCELCGLKYACMGHLRTHLWKHQGMKFQCEDCDKIFGSTKGLNDHRLKHTGAMPFPCLYCDRGYPSTHKYKMHLKTVHKVEPTPDEILRSKQLSKLPKKRLRHTPKLVQVT